MEQTAVVTGHLLALHHSLVDRRRILPPLALPHLLHYGRPALRLLDTHLDSVAIAYTSFDKRALWVGQVELLGWEAVEELLLGYGEGEEGVDVGLEGGERGGRGDGGDDVAFSRG